MAKSVFHCILQDRWCNMNTGPFYAFELVLVTLVLRSMFHHNRHQIQMNQTN